MGPWGHPYGPVYQPLIQGSLWGRVRNFQNMVVRTDNDSCYPATVCLLSCCSERPLKSLMVQYWKVPLLWSRFQMLDITNLSNTLLIPAFVQNDGRVTWVTSFLFFACSSKWVTLASWQYVESHEYCMSRKRDRGNVSRAWGNSHKQCVFWQWPSSTHYCVLVAL